MQIAFWLGLNLSIILLCSYRWQLLHKILGLRPGFGRLVLIRQAGQAVSFITPGPQFGGEPLQIYWLYRLCNFPLGKTILALGLDRFFELSINFLVLLLGVAIVMLFSGQQTPGWFKVIGLLTLLISMLFGTVWVFLSQPRWLLNRLQKLAQRWHKHPRLLLLESGIHAMGENLRSLVKTRKKGLLYVLLLTVVSWAGLLAELWLVLYLVGVHTDLPGFFLILISMRLALLLPLPGGIGTLEASLLWSLSNLGFPAGAALGMIALMRLRDAIVLGTGLLCLRVVQNRHRVVSKAADITLPATSVLPG
jgi:glycosyltransferase 2 family protein